MLKDYNAEIINLDKIGHSIYEKKDSPCYKEIVEAFSTSILTDGYIDRKKLSIIVFSDNEKLNILTNITDKYIYDELLCKINKIKDDNEKDFIIVDGALILDSKVKDLLDYIILVYADFEERLKRVMERDNLSNSMALHRLNSQKELMDRKNEVSKVLVNNRDCLFKQNLESAILSLISDKID